MPAATILLITFMLLAGCGFVVPGTPGHEPPDAGRYNPVARELNTGE